MGEKDPPSIEPDDWFGLLDDPPASPPAPPPAAPPAPSRKKTPVMHSSVPAEGPAAGDGFEAWEWDPTPSPASQSPAPVFTQTQSFSADDVQSFHEALRRPSAEVMSDDPEAPADEALMIDPLDSVAPPAGDDPAEGSFIDFGWFPEGSTSPQAPPARPESAPARPLLLSEPPPDDDSALEFDTPTPRGLIAAAVARGSRPPARPTAPGIPSVMPAPRRPGASTMMFGGAVPSASTPLAVKPAGTSAIPPMAEPPPAESPRASPLPPRPPAAPLSVMRAPTPIVNPIISAEARGAQPTPMPIAPLSSDELTPTPEAAPLTPSTLPPPSEPPSRAGLRAPPRLPPRARALGQIPGPGSPRPGSPPLRSGGLPPLPPPPSRQVPAPPPLPPHAAPRAAPVAAPPAPVAKALDEGVELDENSWSSPPSDDVTPVTFPRREDLARASSLRQHRATPAVGIVIPDEAIPTPMTPPSMPFDEASELALRREMRERLLLEDFNGSLGLAQRLVEIDAHDGEARRVVEQCRKELRASYLTRLGGIDHIPVLTISRSELRWLALDHRAGFVLSLIDGGSSIEDIIDVSTMPSFEVLRTLYTLHTQNVISLRRPRR